MDGLGLALRVGLSLACVLGLVWLFSKGMLRTGGGGGVHRNHVQVVSRQPLSRVASVAVVQVGDRALVLGVTEQHVTLLTETDLPPALDPEARTERAQLTLGTGPDSTERAQCTSETPPDSTERAQCEAARVQGPAKLPQQRGPLTGSALSPATWSQAVEALRERTIRR
jgi:flagellar protein FliO/FliZ